MGGFLRDNAGWLAAGFLLTLSSSFGQTFVISAFAGEILAAFGLSHGQWGAIYSAGTLASAGVMIWAGGLTDRFRVREMAIVVLPFFALACLGMASVSAVWALPLVVFALRFAGQGMLIHIAVVAMGRWFVASRGKALSVSLLGVTLGESLLPLGLVALMGLMGWRMVWVLAAGALVAVLPVLLILLRHERTPQASVAAASAAGMGGRHWTRPEVLRHWLFWAMVPVLLGIPAFVTALFFHQVHLAELKAMPHLALVALFPVFTGCSVAMMLTSGLAVDRFGTPKLLPFLLLPAAAGFIVIGGAAGPAGVAAGMALVGMSAGGNSTLSNAFWAEFFGTRHLGAVKAMAAAVMVLGTAVGPVLTGLGIDAGLGFETQLQLIGGYFLAAGAVMSLGVLRAARALPAAGEVDVAGA